MPYILHIETSTKACSVAVTNNTEILANDLLLPDSFVHAEKLNLLIIKILNIAGLNFKMLNAVAFSSGPGSYTGLRIGLSTAKALCYTLNIPLLYVDTLKIMALKAKSMVINNVDEYFLCPMIDARRMEVYTCIYNNRLELLEHTSAKIVDDDFLKGYAQNTIYFFGNGAPKCRQVLENDKVIYIDGIHPDASFMANDAYYKFLNDEKEDIAYCEPFYLKGFNNT